MNNYIPINLTYYNPATSFFKAERNDRERYNLYSCCNSENCDAYKQGKCVMLNGFGQHCPHGTWHKEVGYTKVAKNCGKLISSIKAKHGDVAYALNELNHLCNIGDYVYLNLPHLVNYENPIRPRMFFMSDSLIRKEDFTPEFVVELIKFKPRSLMGGVIQSYQEEKVPEFVRQLRQAMPEMYAEVQKIYPEVDNIGTLRNMDFTGKRALVKTLKAGKVKISIYEVDWDGEYINFTGGQTTYSEFGKDDVFRIAPSDTAWVKVVDNATVTENTIFVN